MKLIPTILCGGAGFPVKRFVEKPNLEKAREYLASGRYLWNSGMFCFQAGIMLREMRQHCPATLDATRTCIAQSRSAEGKGFSQIKLDATARAGRLHRLRSDGKIAERRRGAMQHRLDDIGSWAALGDLAAPDAQGNRIEGEVILHDVSNCYIQSNQRIVGPFML